MNDKLVKVGTEPTELQSLAGFIKRLADSFRGGELVELFASRADKLDRVAEILSAQVAPVEPTADVADIIAGSLQTSRSHAYELMRNAVIEQDEYFASSTTPQVEPTRAALKELVAVRDIKNGWIARALTGEVPTQEDIDIEDFREVAAWEAARAALKNGGGS